MTPTRRRLLSTLATAFMLLFVSAAWAEPERVTTANYKQAFHYSPDFLRQFVYSTSVTPSWIGKTDEFWYSYRTSKGTTWWRVDPKRANKAPLFDHAKLATQLSEAVKKPLEAAQLPLNRLTISDEGTKIKFVVDDTQYEYEMAVDKLAKLGKAPPAPPVGAFGGNMTEEMRRRFEERRQQMQQQQQQQQQNQQQQNQRQQTVVRRGTGNRGGGMRGGGTGGGNQDYRALSPDRKAYLFVRDNNLYLSESSDQPLAFVLVPGWQPSVPAVITQGWLATVGLNKLRESKAVKLTTDGAEEYSFVRMARSGDGMDDEIVPPEVKWATDSKTFYALRVDTRGVQDLFLVNAIALPRPQLEMYRYPLPGEDAVRRNELFVGDRTSKKLIRVKPKWKDEAYMNIHWGKTSDELRFVRRDRLWRNAEFCSVNVKTGEAKCLILEGFENGPITLEAARYIDETDEMIWWSERSGWGHFYLHARDGKLKNQITAGLFRASRIRDVDAKNRLLYFLANGREPNENIYYEHLYCIHLDGTGLTLMDPGNGNHTSVLSPSKQYVVDNCNRIDMATVSTLRDATGKAIMKLEEVDLSRLQEIGWKMPECFTVKAADGVTDLYGNMWRPFDFDSKKKYPIIVHCYPGPQTEGVQHGFAPISSNQQLAQLGFIVVQVGHRGGTPTRSKAYASYGYFNMRDYGLEDKKAAVEQLAARCPFIDIERVGIYGHSGGGFMSASAVLQKPYNEFFKAAVASAGNHDNNIYNNGWAERYHGMKEVAATKETDAAKAAAQTGTTGTNQGRGTGAGTRQRRTGAEEDDSAAQDTAKKDETQQKTDATKKDDKDQKAEMRFDIKVPTNAELAANLKGALLLVHGDMDNNVHPANTMRLVDALIKANKRFDMLILPGQRHGFGTASPYFNQRMWDFFSDHLIGDRQTGADILEKKEKGK
jgi:dipeptidyl aminopeptidase/acylaminoacyl peptidase